MPRLSVTERRARLLTAAVRLIAREGVAAATTRAIVAEAGMPLASFHYAFASRDELMLEVVRDVVADETLSALAALRVGDDIATSFRVALTAYLETLLADPQRELALQELTAYALRTPGLESFARRQLDAYHEAVTGLLVDGAAAADFFWSRPVEEVARLVVAVTAGVTRAWLADRDTAAARAVIDAAALALAALATPVREPAR